MMKVSFPDQDNLLYDTRTWMYSVGFRGDMAENMAQQIVDFLRLNEPFIIPRELTEEQKSDARSIFEGTHKDRSACHFCAGLHFQVAGLYPSQQPCPRVKKIDRHTDGSTVLSVEYWPNGEWESDVVFPSDVYDEEENSA